MTRLAYLDCVGGLAGDMLLAALLDAGADERILHALPAALGLDGTIGSDFTEDFWTASAHVGMRYNF